jgi:hypothetical protein
VVPVVGGVVFGGALVVGLCVDCTAVMPGGAVGIGEAGGLVVEVGVVEVGVVAVGAFTVVGVPTGLGGGSSLPLTLAPESLLNEVLRHLPGSPGALPITPATVDASTSRPSLVR